MSHVYYLEMGRFGGFISPCDKGVRHRLPRNTGVCGGISQFLNFSRENWVERNSGVSREASALGNK